ncbi:hypothetical protein AS361_07835 [Myroides marinus]|uniref:DEAD/DEAH box helicase n=2 Tax=Myroides marinus TaxID=703342 RepID=UPI0007419AF6|nr:DEAD/DEAH box helicase [Myroides marinus]KUF45623.1 hypothetical protein AS361_07835 [Myroides marinus]
MEELITPFNDYPIEFKELNPDDFEFFNVAEKIIITPNADGYINRELQNAIDLSTKNTVVVNAGVGQGKTYSIIQLVKQYYELEGYVIFIASPYMSLVQQYYDKTKDCGIPEGQIYRYENIGINRGINPEGSKVHILTVNALLGNPGEDALINSQAKRDYINHMVKYCEENNKKAVFIYDEIHDAIHNFKEEYIFTLWKWRNVIHKNLIISATFNEASKIVIKYLANLTEKKIQLIESKRIRIVEKQSELYLHYNNNQYYNYNDENIVNLLKLLIEHEKDIDILSYSKTLADNICKNTHEERSIGNILIQKYSEIQNCTTALDNNQRPDREIPTNRYDPLKCNVGTNFKTGISIEKENHAFIIIMPPKGAKSLFKNNYGVFTDGINAIIQALARQRKKGEIHVILPSPDTIDYSTLPFFSEHDKVEVFKQLYTNGKEVSEDSENLVKYISINNQKNILEDYYNDVYRKNVEEELEFFSTSDIQHTPEIRFPSLERFIITSGEKYLVNKYPFFGGDLSSYITYSAITNQFINCKFKGVFYSKKDLILTWNNINLGIEKYFADNIDIDYYNGFLIYLSDIEFYCELKEMLFVNNRILLQKEDGTTEEIKTQNSNKHIEQSILTIIQNYRYSNAVELFDRGEYFRAKVCEALNTNIDLLNEDIKDINEAYLTMNHFREKIVNSIQETLIRGQEVKYISSRHADSFIEDSEIERFDKMINTLINKDIFLKNGVYDFSRSFIRTQDKSKHITTFYNIIKECFFNTARRSINRTNQRCNVVEILEVLEVENQQMFQNNSMSEEQFNSLQDISEILTL